MVLKQLNADHYLFFCPACDDPHVIGPEWSFNGDFDTPKFHPSYYDADAKTVCHLFITDGCLHYLPDCTHELSEQTVPMAPIPDWLLGDEDVA